MKEFIRFLAILGVLILLSYTAAGQTAPDCPHPSGCVVLSREAALKALADSDRVKALEAENKTLKEVAIPGLKDILADMREKYAEAKGENTVYKQRAVSDQAEKELLFKMVRPKKFGVINF